MDRKREKKDDDETYIPFSSLDKGTVLQEKNAFNETPLNPRKCCQILTKLLFLVSRGEKFTKIEATEVFFAVTKLFQSKDIPLRRMVYLVLKELMTMSDDVIIVMSSLTKDINSKVDVYRANAIRVLCGITDSAMLGQVERYLKQAIVDKEAYVASAALVSGIYLMRTNQDIVKRWVSEVQEALQSRSGMVQYHALGLLHQIKRTDRLAVAKLVQGLIKSSIRSPYAHCLLIRFTSQLLEEDPNAGDKGYFSYLETCLRHKSDMVIYEAARAICTLKGITSREIGPAVTALQLFLSSPKPALRFAAVRTLNKVAQTHPLSVTTCSMDMEHLITDSNRSIATLAITTLLKTGSESSIDKLMKQLSLFMPEISDEFKIVVVDAIRALCLKFPKKQRTLLNFLSTILREEGGFEYKKAIVNTILNILKELPDTKEIGLTYLCEFIEDCEFAYLSIKILYLLGREGPNTLHPSRYIRYIYNRVCLEKGNVRAAAVSALAKFGIKLPALKSNVIVLLRRCANDNDDEVRDRAVFYLNTLEQIEEQQEFANLAIDEFKIPLVNLEKSLLEYQSNPTEQPFDLSKVSLIIQQKEAPRAQKAVMEPVSVSIKPKEEESQDVYAAIFASMPQFSGLGPLLRSSKSVELTESETEYVVSCIKHVFEKHIVFQFNCTNTLKEVVLENVTVKMDTSAIKNLKVEFMFPLAKLAYGEPGSCYVCVSKLENIVTGTIQNTLKFVSKEVDPSTGLPEESGFADEYKLEDLELAPRDYLQPTPISEFQTKWDELGDQFEVVETYALSTLKSLQAAVNEIIKTLGMAPSDNSDNVPAKRSKHILYLSGTFIGNIPVLVRARMKFVEGQGVQTEITVRSSNDDVSTLIAGAI